MTDAERVEVAAELRKLAAVTAYVHLPGSNLASLLFSAIHNGTEWDVSDRNPDGLFLNRLADLIEPQERTCHAVRIAVPFDPRDFPDDLVEVYQFRCSECSVLLEDDWSFCPNCGAKVIHDA